MKTAIKIFHYDDMELLKTISHLLGSTDWNDEHDQPLMRQKSKVFYCLFIDGEFVSMLSMNKNVIGDCHTEPAFRNKGCMKTLLSKFNFESGTRTITKNEAMIHLFKEIGFVEYGKNGRFTRLKKVNE